MTPVSDLYRVLFEQPPDAILVIDPETMPDGGQVEICLDNLDLTVKGSWVNLASGRLPGVADCHQGVSAMGRVT